MPRICLNMIVKNEAPVIERCLASVKPWIDHWVIVDTGSSDGTQARIREFMKDVPGELHERPWRDFAFNRNQALDLARAKGDLVLFIDADETLAVPEGFVWPALPADGYQLQCNSNGWNYFRNSLVATRLPWRWEGVLHEYLTCNLPHAWENLLAPSNLVSHDGLCFFRPRPGFRALLIALLMRFGPASQHALLVGGGTPCRNVLNRGGGHDVRTRVTLTKPLYRRALSAACGAPSGTVPHAG